MDMLRKIIIGTALMFMLSVSAFAQDKYEYALVRYWNISGTGDANGVWVNYAGKDWEQVVKVEYKEIKSNSKGPFTLHYGPLLDYLQKMSGEGWEVISIGDGQTNYTLRRKKAN